MAFGDYVDWRAKHPSDDLMTQLLNVEFEDEKGVTRKLSREEVLTFLILIAAAGNDTTNRLIGWIGKVLGDNPDQRQLLSENPSRIPNAIEEILRLEAAVVPHRPLCRQGRRVPRSDGACRQHADVPARCRTPRRPSFQRPRNL